MDNAEWKQIFEKECTDESISGLIYLTNIPKNDVRLAEWLCNLQPIDWSQVQVLNGTPDDFPSVLNKPPMPNGFWDEGRYNLLGKDHCLSILQKLVEKQLASTGLCVNNNGILEQRWFWPEFDSWAEGKAGDWNYKNAPFWKVKEPVTEHSLTHPLLHLPHIQSLLVGLLQWIKPKDANEAFELLKARYLGTISHRDEEQYAIAQQAVVRFIGWAKQNKEPENVP